MGYTIAQAAEKLGVSTATIRRRIKSGEIKADMVDTPYGKQYIVDDSLFSPGAVITELVPIEKTLTIEQFVQALREMDRGSDKEIVERLSAQGDEMAKQGDEIRALHDEIIELKELLLAKQEEKPSIWKRLFKKGE